MKNGRMKFNFVSVKRDRTCACIVTHTYKQIRKLWDNPDKSHHPTSRPQISTNTNSPLLGKNTINKFNQDIDQSTSSDTGISSKCFKISYFVVTDVLSLILLIIN